jgi:hypothetical protein
VKNSAGTVKSLKIGDLRGTGKEIVRGEITLFIRRDEIY